MSKWTFQVTTCSKWTVFSTLNCRRAVHNQKMGLCIGAAFSSQLPNVAKKKEILTGNINIKKNSKWVYSSCLVQRRFHLPLKWVENVFFVCVCVNWYNLNINFSTWIITDKWTDARNHMDVKKINCQSYICITNKNHCCLFKKKSSGWNAIVCKRDNVIPLVFCIEAHLWGSR